MKKFSTKRQLTTPKKLASAGRALETRLETWLGRVRKRVSRNETAMKKTVKRVDDLTIQLAMLEPLVEKVAALEAEVQTLRSRARP
jgi:hypothetical protein